MSRIKLLLQSVEEQQFCVFCAGHQRLSLHCRWSMCCTKEASSSEWNRGWSLVLVSSAKKGQCPWSGLFGSEDVFVCQLELKGSRDPGGCGILCLGLDARLCVTPLGRLGLGVVQLDIRTWWRSSLEGCWSWKLRKSPSSSRSELLEKTAFGLGNS